MLPAKLVSFSQRTVPALLQGGDEVGGAFGDRGDVRRREPVEVLQFPQRWVFGQVLPFCGVGIEDQELEASGGRLVDGLPVPEDVLPQEGW